MLIWRRVKETKSKRLRFRQKKFKENKDGVKRDGSFKESKKSFKKSFRGLLESRKKAKDLAGN